MESRRIAAIILAAGMSRRMGTPKMVLPWGETTVLGQVVAVMAAALAEARTDWEADKRMEVAEARADELTEKRIGIAEERTDEAAEKRMSAEIIVVTGGARKLVEAEVARLAVSFPARTVFNAQHEAGEMMSSIRAGLAVLGPEVESALIGLGDQPQVSLEAARKVVAAWKMSGSRLIIPSFNMRRGHPWLVGRALWPDLVAATTAREFLNTHADEIFYVDCDESVLKDLDTPEEYARGLKSAR